MEDGEEGDTRREEENSESVRAAKEQGDPSGCEASQHPVPCNNHTALGLPRCWDISTGQIPTRCPQRAI